MVPPFNFWNFPLSLWPGDPWAPQALRRSNAARDAALKAQKAC